MSTLEIKAKSLLNLNESDPFSKLVGKTISFNFKSYKLIQLEVFTTILSVITKNDTSVEIIKTGIFSHKENTVDYFEVSIRIASPCLHFDASSSQSTSTFRVVVDVHGRTKITSHSFDKEIENLKIYY